MMKRGALVVLDALGFRGIWKRPEVRDDPTVAIRALQRLREQTKANVDEASAVLNEPDETGHVAKEVTIRSVFLSDTIVIAVQPDKDDPGRNAYALRAAAYLASQVIEIGIKSPLALTFRGCVSFGQFHLEESFMVGEAVDEAAEHMDLAEAALVWFAPSARKAVQRHYSNVSEPFLAPPYRVPLKEGASYRTYVVSPFNSIEDSKGRKEMTAKILATFQGSLAVEIKRQNTEDFLRDRIKASKLKEDVAKMRAENAARSKE